MIDSIEFKNFKVLRDTTLPLRQFTLIVGPNGSGKTTALQAIACAASPEHSAFDDLVTAKSRVDTSASVELRIRGLRVLDKEATALVLWTRSQRGTLKATRPGGGRNETADSLLKRQIVRIRVYALDPGAISRPVELRAQTSLDANGGQLAGVLDRLRDDTPERFEALNDELSRWLPEFDRILFDTPQQGHRAIALRTRDGGHKIPAKHVSQGTLLALAILTLAYLPEPPPLVGFEEPDRGIHPRLLRDVRDALYRLAYPQDFGEKREPVQVIATTHSPYFMDLFRDHPDEIVIAEKVDAEARFVKLTSLPNVDEILRDSHLGEAWYSGILGGVPAEP